MSKKIIILVGAVIVAVGVAGYLYFTKTDETPLSEVIPEAVKDIKETLGGGPGTDNWLTYKSAKHAFGIKYPPNYEVREESGGVLFVPPELKDTTEPPKTLEELPLGVIIPPDKSYEDIKKEIKTESAGAEYSEEAARIIAGIQGTELKLGPKTGSADNLHKLYNIIPYKDAVLIFFTFAVGKEQLEGEGVPLLDAFISTFKSE